MNKRGTLGITIISCIFLLIIGFMTVNFLFDEVDTFRVGLNCANATAIHDGAKLTCLIGDITIPYYIYIILTLVIGGILVKLIF